MNVAERERGHVPAALSQAETLGDLHAIGRRGIQFFVDFGAMTVLFAADRADFDFQDRARGDGLVEQLFGDGEVFVQRNRRTIPHVGLEHRLAAVRHLIGLHVQQGTHPTVQILLGAMVCVQRDGDMRVALRHLMRERRERQRPGHAVVHALTGKIRGAAH